MCALCHELYSEAHFVTLTQCTVNSCFFIFILFFVAVCLFVLGGGVVVVVVFLFVYLLLLFILWGAGFFNLFSELRHFPFTLMN